MQATSVMASEGFSAKVENELTALGHTGTHVATLYATGHEARPLPNQPQPPPPLRMTPAMPSLAVPLAGGSKQSGRLTSCLAIARLSGSDRHGTATWLKSHSSQTSTNACYPCSHK
jgi:hypothetical protein